MNHEIRKLNSPTHRLVVLVVFILFFIPLSEYILDRYHIDQKIEDAYFSTSQEEAISMINKDQLEWEKIKNIWEKYEDDGSLSADERWLIDSLLLEGTDVSHEIDIRFQVFEWVKHPSVFKEDTKQMVDQIESLISGPLSATYSQQQINHYQSIQSRLESIQEKEIDNHNPFFFYWFSTYENVVLYLSFIMALVLSISLLQHGQITQSLGWMTSHRKTKRAIMFNQLVALGVISLVSVVSLYIMYIIVATVLFGWVNPMTNVQSIYHLRYTWPSMNLVSWIFLKISIHTLVVYSIVLWIAFLYRLIKSRLIFAFTIILSFGSWILLSISNISFFKTISLFAFMNLSNQIHTIEVFLIPSINITSFQLMNLLLLVSIVGLSFVLWRTGIATLYIPKTFNKFDQHIKILFKHTHLKLHQWTKVAINQYGAIVFSLVLVLFVSISVYESSSTTKAGFFNQRLYDIYVQYKDVSKEEIDNEYFKKIELNEELEKLRQRQIANEILDNQTQERLEFLEQSKFERALFMNFYNNISYHKDITYHYGYQQWFSINSTHRESFKIILLVIMIILAGHLVCTNDRSMVIETSLKRKRAVLINQKVMLLLISIGAFVLLSGLDLYLINSRYPITTFSHEIGSILVDKGNNWQINGLIQESTSLGVSMMIVLGLRLLAVINAVLIWLVVHHLTSNKWLSSLVVILIMLISAFWMSSTSYLSLYALFLGSHAALLNARVETLIVWMIVMFGLTIFLYFLIKRDDFKSNLIIK